MTMENRILDTIIVGAGQSGLAMAHELALLGKNYLVLDGDTEVGGSWLRRWDSLKLFTPTEFNHLPGLNFPAHKGHYPDKYEVANYLKSYVDLFKIPVELNQMVFAIEKDEEGVFCVECQERKFYAREVIMATGPFHIPFTPAFSSQLDDSVKQLHSKEYRNVKQLNPGTTVVVGGGDSGVQIAEEIASTDSPVFMSCAMGKMNTIPQEILGKTLWWWFETTGLLNITVNSWLGKIISKKMQPIIGTDVKALFGRKNVKKVGKAVTCFGNKMMFEDGTEAVINNVVWATGYKPDFSILKFDNLLGENGYPKQERGVTEVEGLFFIGLPWMYTRGSATLGGVGKDAQYLKNKLSKVEPLGLAKKEVLKSETIIA